jgi:hypothetical protein
MSSGCIQSVLALAVKYRSEDPVPFEIMVYIPRFKAGRAEHQNAREDLLFRDETYHTLIGLYPILNGQDGGSAKKMDVRGKHVIDILGLGRDDRQIRPGVKVFRNIDENGVSAADPGYFDPLFPYGLYRRGSTDEPYVFIFQLEVSGDEAADRA